MEKFFGLRVKLYCFKLYGSEIEEKNCKGVIKIVLKKIFYWEYKDNLFSEKYQMRMMKVIRLYGYEIFIEMVNKVVLSVDDDKRGI